jgi:hypothetical protein
MKEILGDKDPQSAVGKACLFVAAQPSVSAFTVPYMEGTTSEEASVMLLSALKTLANLTTGGLDLDGSYSSVSIDLALPGAVDAVGHARDWPITEHHFGVLFSVPMFGSVLTSLRLSNSNIKAGLGHFVNALPGFLALKELDISNNELGAEEAKPIGEALSALKVWPSFFVSVCICPLSTSLHACHPTTGQRDHIEVHIQWGLEIQQVSHYGDGHGSSRLQ